jgi:Protein of unknown function (DUF5818)
MSHKIAKLAFRLIPIVCLSLCPVALIAQSAAPEKKAENSSHTVTGCLQKGDEAGEFSLKGEDGKTWGLRSTSVKLDQHIGHQVTVTGSTTHETKAEEKKEGQVENAGSKTEYADLTVTNLKMVSESCSK